MDDLSKRIAHSNLFSSLKDRQRDEVLKRARRRNFRKGELITLHGDVWPYFLMVNEGTLNAVKESSAGRRLVVLSLDPGEFFWGLAFFDDDATMPVTFEAHSDCQIYLWDKESLLPILLENGQVVWELCRLMIARMQQVSEIVEGLAFLPVAARMAQFIIKRFGDSSNVPVARDLTLDEMAAMIGTTHEQVCRILYRFADEDLIEITRTEFVLTDKDGLTQLFDD